MRSNSVSAPLAAAAILASAVVLSLPLSGCSGPTAEQVAAHRAEIEEWQAGREERLRDPEGWLTLVGLYWLEPGDNSIGSSEDNAVVLATDACPARAGKIVVVDGTARIVVSGDAPIERDGERVRTQELADDVSGEPTILAVGSLRFYVIQRNGELAVRVRDLESPALRSFEGLEEYPIDYAWRFNADFEAYDPPKKIQIPNIVGQVAEEDCAGALVFRKDGRTYRIDTIDAGDEFFLIFADETTGEETYEGGRYMYVSKPDADGKVVLDFNKAYNPPCVFSPYATCPLPPEDNRLAVAVTAGEKHFETLIR